jgi:DNA-directed RNA polymerase subunit M/transcription elongation factor TFIIS
MANCPNCNVDLEFDDDELDEGDELNCGECGAMVRVSGTDPVELESIDDDDDFDDDDEDDDDEEEDEGDDDGYDYDEDGDDDDDWT